LRRIRRHTGWLRTEGPARLIEEGDLDPLDRIPSEVRKILWRLRHDASPHALPIFVVGLQRSGTNMLVQGLERSPLIELHNEKDRAAFHRFRLRSDEEIRGIVERSPHPFVLFKPLCDSHRIGALLDGLRTPSAPRATWVVRSVDGRVRSSVAKFGDANRRALQAIVDGSGASLWQSQGLSDRSVELIRSSDPQKLSAESASALFWYVRNSIVFEHGLVERPDFRVVSYDRFVADPIPSMRALCSFLEIPFDPSFAAHIAPRNGHVERRLEIEPAIRERCDELSERLEAAAGTDVPPRGSAA
jgi:hypothetical protein